VSLLPCTNYRSSVTIITIIINNIFGLTGTAGGSLVVLVFLFTCATLKCFRYVTWCAVLSLVSSILTLTLIACDRFFGIVFAMKARVTERRSTLLIALVWILAVVLSSPILVYRRQFVRQWLDHTEIWCDDTWPPVS